MSWWIPATELAISHDPNHWKWTRYDSCSFEVAELLRVSLLEISGKVDVRKLQENTSYSAFLVFKLKDNSTRHLEKANVTLTYLDNYENTHAVFIDTKSCNLDDLDNSRSDLLPHLRSDGWSEIMLGEFFTNSGDNDGYVGMHLFDRDEDKEKSGLIVQGMHVRPNIINGNNSDAVSSKTNWFHLPEIDGATKNTNYVVSPATASDQSHVNIIRVGLVFMFCLVFLLLCVAKTHVSILVLFSLAFILLSAAFFRMS